MLDHKRNNCWGDIHWFWEMNKCRIRHQRCSVTKGVLRNFAKLTRKHLCHSLFVNKVASLRAVTLLKKRLWCRFFPVRSRWFRRCFPGDSASGTYTLQKMLQNYVESNLRQVLRRLTKTLEFWQYLTVFSHCQKMARCSLTLSILEAQLETWILWCRKA